MELQVKNFKCFDEKKLYFTKNLNLIFGKSGSGKSSIFNSIIFGLTGSEKINIKSYSKKTCKVFISIGDLVIERSQTPNRLIVKKNGQTYEDDYAQNIISNFVNIDILKIEGLSSLKNIENFLFFGIHKFVSLNEKIKSRTKIHNKKCKELDIRMRVLKPMIDNFKIEPKYETNIPSDDIKEIYKNNSETLRMYEERVAVFNDNIKKYNRFMLLVQNLHYLEFLICRDGFDDFYKIDQDSSIICEFLKYIEARKEINKIRSEIKIFKEYSIEFNEKDCDEILSSIDKFKNFKYYISKNINDTDNLEDKKILTCPKCKVGCFIVNDELKTTEYFIEQNKFKNLKSYFETFRFTKILIENYDNINLFQNHLKQASDTYKKNKSKIIYLQEKLYDLNSKYPEKYLGFKEISDSKYEQIKNLVSIDIKKIKNPTIYTQEYYNELACSFKKKMQYTILYDDNTIIEMGDFKKIAKMMETLYYEICTQEIFDVNYINNSEMLKLQVDIKNRQSINSNLIEQMEILNRIELYKQKKGIFEENLQSFKTAKSEFEEENDSIKVLSQLKTLNDESVLIYLNNIIDIINNYIDDIISEFFPDKNIKLFLSIYIEKKEKSEYKINHKIFFNNELCEYKNLSTGEKSRIDLICKLSFCKLLDFYNSSDQKINILLLDEKTLNIEKDLEFEIFCLIKKMLSGKWFIICSTHDTVEGVFDNIISL